MARTERSREPSDGRRALVAIETIRSEFQVVLDGQRGITERLDGVEEKVNVHYQEIKKYLMDGLKKVYEDMEEVGSRLKKVEGRR